jgi:hypothetical protein
MIGRVAAISFIAVSLAIANTMVLKAYSHSREQNEEDHVYRYSRTFGKFFLFMIPVMAGMMFFMWSTDPHPLRGGELVAFGMASGVFIGLPVFGYAFVIRYRVSVDNRGITVASVFMVRFIAFSDIAAIATMRGKGTDYWLYSVNGRCIAKIGGSVQDFSSLQDDVELATRSKQVILYDWNTFQGWRERANDAHGDWRKSEGPPSIRDRNRRLNIEMVIGGLLVAALVAYIHFYLR